MISQIDTYRKISGGSWHPLIRTQDEKDYQKKQEAQKKTIEKDYKLGRQLARTEERTNNE